MPGGMKSIRHRVTLPATKNGGQGMGISFRTGSRLLGAVAVTAVGVEVLAGRGDAVAAWAGMTQAEISALHAALFFATVWATVWIVSSLRIDRLGARWRAGFGRKAVRGASGSLQPAGPDARAAAGGSVRGAGASGGSAGARRIGETACRRPRPAAVNDNDGSPMLDNFRR